MKIAGAPVSFGVFEMTPDDAEVIDRDDMVRILHDTGYAGIDLGPVGYLGRGTELRDRLRAADLDLAGGWVELPLSDDTAFEAALGELDAALRIFADWSEHGPGLLPKPTLADHGSPARKSAPGRGSDVDRLDDAGWDRLAANTATAAERVRAVGLEPTFHHHAGTFVESPDEIDRFLDRVDVGLTLDTGHLAIGGGDSLEVIDRWGARVNHLHVKDVDLVELERVISAGGGMTEVWSSGAFVAFGRGGIDLAGVMDRMQELGYDGWVVVEQDVLPAAGVTLSRFRDERTADHRVNRDVLRRWH